MSINIAIFVLTVVPGGKVRCESNPFTYQWFAISLVDLGQSIFILICSYNIIEQVRQRKEEEQDRFGELNLDNDDGQYKCLVQQIKHMAVSYLLFSFMDLIILASGDIMDNPKHPIFLCAHEWYLLPLTDSGSLFFLVDGMLLTLFTLNLSHIFFIIPYRNGLLVKNVQAHSID